MDTGNGTLVKINEKISAIGDAEKLLDAQALNNKIEALQKQYPNHSGVFQTGSAVEINGVTFSVGIIGKTTVQMKLLKGSLQEFRPGLTISFNNSVFKIKEVARRSILLKLLPRE